MMKNRALFSFLTFLILFSCSNHLSAQVFKTQEIALSESFAEADTVIRWTLFLNEGERQLLENLAKSKVNTRVISYYEGYKGGALLATAFFDAQIIRTKKAILQVVISPDGHVKKVDVLAFFEPQDYLPIEKWLALFIGKQRTVDLWPGQSIHAVSGATLTGRAFTEIVRRALAVNQFINERRK